MNAITPPPTFDDSWVWEARRALTDAHLGGRISPDEALRAAVIIESLHQMGTDESRWADQREILARVGARI